MKWIRAVRRALFGKVIDWRFRQRQHKLEGYVCHRLEPELEARGFTHCHAQAFVSLRVPTVHLRRADFGTQDQINVFEVDVDEMGDKRLFFRPFVLFFSPAKTIFDILLGEGPPGISAFGSLGYEEIFGPLPLRNQSDADRAVEALIKHWLPLLDQTATLQSLHEALSRSRRAHACWVDREGWKGLIQLAHLLQSPQLPQHMADYVAFAAKEGPQAEMRAEGFVRCMQAMPPLDWAPPYSPRRGPFGDEGVPTSTLAAHDERDDMMTTLAFHSLVRLMARDEAEAREFTARLNAVIVGGETVSLALLRGAAEPALCVFDWRGAHGQHLMLGDLINAWGMQAAPIEHHDDMARQFDAASKVARACRLALLAVETLSDMFVFLCVRADDEKMVKELLHSAGLRTV
ncbi:DUF6630 family protein [Ottowia testudinis]|uniref:DUF6630 domain-containing protein n=1 Tax=Ottowia testudinis TaxID=2816950 RepID=A0A975CIG6_9BURK|nr:hypothetical protein [Ottowia testudinis]QTD46179.1 hypothetical protein J1M35_04545 [Ottowia testudinis]